MIVVALKQDFEHFWNCLQELKPLSPPDGRWNSSRALIAAAALLFDLLSRSLEDGNADTAGERVLEHDEARAVAARRKIFAAMQLLSLVVGEVATGGYDEVYGPVLRFAVDLDGDDRVLLRPVTGFKQVGEGDVMTYDIWKGDTMAAKSKSKSKAAARNDHHPDAIDFRTFAEGLDLMDELVAHRSLESCSASDLACWLHNVGSVDDRTEALLALLPIARRAYSNGCSKKPRATASARRRRSRKDRPRKNPGSRGARAARSTGRRPITRCRNKNPTRSLTCSCPSSATNVAASLMKITSINKFRWRFRGDRSSDDSIFTSESADAVAGVFARGTRCRPRMRSGRPPRSWVRIFRP